MGKCNHTFVYQGKASAIKDRGECYKCSKCDKIFYLDDEGEKILNNSRKGKDCIMCMADLGLLDNP